MTLKYFFFLLLENKYWMHYYSWKGWLSLTRDTFSTSCRFEFKGREKPNWAKRIYHILTLPPPHPSQKNVWNLLTVIMFKVLNFHKSGEYLKVFQLLDYFIFCCFTKSYNLNLIFSSYVLLYHPITLRLGCVMCIT